MQFAGVFFLFFLFYWPSNWKTSSKFFFTFWTTVAPQSLSSDMITIGISFNWTPSFIGIIRIYWATVISFSIPFEWKYTRLIRAWSTYCFACTWFFTTIHSLQFQNITFCHYFASQLTCSHICLLQINDFWHCIVMSKKMLAVIWKETRQNIEKSLKITYFRFNWVQPSGLIECCWLIVHYTPAIIWYIKCKWCFLSYKLSNIFILNVSPIDFDVLISVWSRLFMIKSQGMNEFMLNCPLSMTSSACRAYEIVD